VYQYNITAIDFLSKYVPQHEDAYMTGWDPNIMTYLHPKHE